MKKEMITFMLVLVMFFLVGCGKEVSATQNTNESIEISSMETEKNIDETMGEVMENENLTNLDAVADSDETNLNLKEYKYSFEDKNVANEGDAVFYLADFEDDAQYLSLNDSIRIYAFNGKCIGHTKEDIEINTIGRYGDWYYLMLDRDYRFVRVADVEATATDMSSGEKGVVASIETTIPVQNENVTISSEQPTQDISSVSDEPIEESISSNKYTPDEAVAVYRSLMEAGGITWNPALKDVSSWGTGWIELQKGMPEWCAEINLESFAMGDSAGNPWTEFYFEVTGSDEDSVYITEWHN